MKIESTCLNYIGCPAAMTNLNGAVKNYMIMGSDNKIYSGNMLSDILIAHNTQMRNTDNDIASLSGFSCEQFVNIERRIFRSVTMPTG